MSRRATALALLTVAVPIAGQGPTAAQYRGNPSLTGEQPARAIRAIRGVAWTLATGGPIRGTPTLADGTLYFGSTDGRMRAVEPGTGRLRWEVEVGAAMASTPAVLGSTVYITTRAPALLALAAADGSVQWRVDLGRELVDGEPHDLYWDYYSSSPTIAGNELYVGSGDGSVRAFDAATGRVRWRHEAGSRVRTTPAVAGDLVVFGTKSGHIRALDRATGQLRWSFATVGVGQTFESGNNDRRSIMTAPMVTGTTVIAGGRDGFLYALDAATGRERWRVDHDGSWLLSIAVRDGVVFAGSGSGSKIQAVDLATGAERWNKGTRGGVFTVTLAGDQVYYQDIGGNLTALEAASGARRWQYPVPGASRVFASPLVTDDHIYTTADDGVLVALAADRSGRAIPAEAERLVYWEEESPKVWFSAAAEAYLRTHFSRMGFRVVGDSALHRHLSEQVANPTGSVVVFASHWIPDTVATEAAGTPLIRRYLDAGGKVVLFGPNPLAYPVNPESGAIESMDLAIPARVFGLPMAGRYFESTGYYRSVPTAEGQRMGLRDWWTGMWSMPADAVDTVLGTDEFGLAGAWLKGYGGPAGTGLLQLSLPQNNPGHGLLQLQPVIQYGVTW